MDRRLRLTAGGLAAVIVGICLLTVAGGWALKGQCLDPWAKSHQYESLCYNDIHALTGGRGVQARIFPYIHGSLNESGSELLGGAIEYPVLTGLFMYVAGTGVEDPNAYLQQTALLLFPFALLVAFLLVRLEGARALMWAAAPAVVLYSFHNWDLLVVAAVVGGFYAFRRERTFVAAALFGLGAAFKMYPAFFVLPLVASSLFLKDKRRAALEVAVGAGTFIAVNLPFILINREGWWATYRFHQLRVPNFDSVWSLRDSFQVPIDLPMLPKFTFGIVLPQMTPERLNLITGVLTLVAFAVALYLGWRRARRDEVYPMVEVSAALLCAFMLFSKVHSPQYALWLLPFFVLVRINVLWWVAYSVVDLLVYVGVFRFFYDYFENPTATGAHTAMEVGVWLRAGLLAVLFFVFLQARRKAGPILTSHPLPTVDPVGEMVKV